MARHLTSQVVASGRNGSCFHYRLICIASPRWDKTFVEPLRAVRLGLSLISGMREAAALRLMAARAAAPFETVEDMAMRAELDAHDLRCLSGADALATLSGHRPDAVWEATGVDTRPTEMLRQARTVEDPIAFEAPGEALTWRTITPPWD